MAQTAVEWLIGKIKSYGKHDAVIMNERYFSESKLLDYLEQAKEMEKEQMVDFAEFVAKYPDKNRNYLNQMLHAKSKYDGAERTIDLLELYYNETHETE
jgi:hypothetical protein